MGQVSMPNSLGQVIGYRDAKGNTVAYEYDIAGRLTKIDYPHDTDVIVKPRIKLTQ